METPATVEDSRVDESGAPRDRPSAERSARARQLRIAVVGIALLAALGVLARQTIGDAEPTARRGATGAQGRVEGPVPAAPSSGPATQMPRGPGAFDGFDRPGPEDLGVADSGRAWRAAQGTWGTDRAQARLVAPEPGRYRSLAVIELGAADASVEVAVTTVRPGCGLVFRYRNPLNYWFVSAVPDLATWSIGYVAQGTVVDLGNLGLVSTAAGTVIGVRLVGSAIEAFVDGAPAATFEDPTLAGETGAGLLAGGNSPAGARWDNFVATGRPAETVAEPPPTPSGGTVGEAVRE